MFLYALDNGLEKSVHSFLVRNTHDFFSTQKSGFVARSSLTDVPAIPLNVLPKCLTEGSLLPGAGPPVRLIPPLSH